MLLAQQVLQPGEQVRWLSDEGVGLFSVRGREANGEPEDRVFRVVWAVLKAIGHFIMAVAASTQTTGVRRLRPPPRSVVFGRDPGCRAVFRPELRLTPPGVGLWVATDLRFMRIRLHRNMQGRLPQAVEAAPARCEVEFQEPIAEVTFENGVRRRLKGNFKPKRAVYDRFTLRDGSGFDIAS